MTFLFDMPFVLAVDPIVTPAIVGGAMLFGPVILAVTSTNDDDDDTDSSDDDDSGSYSREDANNDFADIADAATDLFTELGNAHNS